MSFYFDFNSIDSPIAIFYKGKKYSQLKKDYEKLTIKKLNSILKNEKIKKTFNFDQNYFLQLLPAYIHKYIEISLKISDIITFNKLDIDCDTLLKEAIKTKIFMASLNKNWMGDLDFFINFFRKKFQLSI